MLCHQPLNLRSGTFSLAPIIFSEGRDKQCRAEMDNWVSPPGGFQIQKGTKITVKSQIHLHPHGFSVEIFVPAQKPVHIHQICADFCARL